MKSQFKYGAYVLVFLILFSGLIFVAVIFVVIWQSLPIGLAVMGVVVEIFMGTWLVYGELRTKVLSVDIAYDSFIIKRYLGSGAPETYYFNELDGYKTSILPASYTAYEYLYLIKGGKKVVKMSEFYHKNYAEMKKMIDAAKISNLGYEEYSYGREFKEIFA